MKIGIENALGVHPQALSLRAARTQALARNIANADTPGYKARDIDFSRSLNKAMGAADAGALRTTDPRHISGSGIAAKAAIEFRESDRHTPDGNTVQIEEEQAAYTENAVKFQASAQFFDGALRGLRLALRGDR